MGQTLDHFVRHHAAKTPDKIFWRQISGATVTETSFAAFHDRALAFANRYRDLGVAPGQLVLIFLPQQMDGVAAFFGAMLAGIVPSFMPCPSSKQHPAVYWPAHTALMARIKPQLLVTDTVNATQMRLHGIAGAAGILTIDSVVDGPRVLPSMAIDPVSTALLQHSSGTTSLKKGVALSHRAILRQVEAYAARLGMTASDNIVSWLPVYHDMGLIAATVTPLVLGQTVTSISPFEWVARPVSLFEALARYDGHFTWMPNFAFEHLVRGVPRDCAEDLAGVRAFIDCSEPCKADTFDRFAIRFSGNGVRPDQLQVCYAMAETVFAVTQTVPGRPPVTIDVDAEQLYGAGRAVPAAPGTASVRLLSNGAPVDGMAVRIRNDAGDLPARHVGEIVLSSDFLFGGYFNDPATTAERLRDGLYHTRDRGFMADGNLYVLGRTDDLLIINGRNLHAHEVEAMVGDIPALKPGRAVAFGLFNEGVGSEELVIVAERDPDAISPGIKQLSKRIRAAVYEQTNIEVKTCRIVEPGWLVKTTSGKISRQANQAKFLAETDATAAAPAHADDAERPVFERLAMIIAATFTYPWADVRRDTTADDVDGWDSLSHASLILRVEQAFGIRFRDSEIFGFADVGELADRTTELLAAPEAEAAPDRVIYKTDAATIIRLGGPEAPDVIVFAGRETIPGDMDMASFSSVFANFNGGHATQYYVTDKKMDFYLTCLDDVARFFNETLSDRPKILFGNSMGGYGALRMAPKLKNVTAVMTLVARVVPPAHAFQGMRRDRRGELPVTLAPGVRYCALYGSDGDYKSRESFEALAKVHGAAHVGVVPNCGHNLVRYLNNNKLLRDLVRCTLKPETMAAEAMRLVSHLKPLWHDEAWLISRFRELDESGVGRLTHDQVARKLHVIDRNFTSLDTEGRGYVTLDDVLRRRLTLA